MRRLPTDAHGKQEGRESIAAADREADRLCNLAPPTRQSEEEVKQNIYQDETFKTEAIKCSSAG